MSNWLQFVADETTVVIVPPTALITKPNMVLCGVCLLYRQFWLFRVVYAAELRPNTESTAFVVVVQHHVR